MNSKIVGFAAVGMVASAFGCAPSGNEPEGTAAQALGEPISGFPSWEERVVHVWTNRARAAPAADLAGCSNCAEAACYSPVPPLVWSHELSRSARFHSANLTLGGCGLQHDSPCVLAPGFAQNYTPGPCDGNPACACQAGTLACGSAQTSWSARISAFGVSPSGENIVRGLSDPIAAFYAWLYEPDSNSACGFRQSNGHRYNILSANNRGVGVGLHATTYTQDFRSTSTPSGIVGGVHYPKVGTSIDFRANWYSTSAPTLAQVNVDGSCSTMSLERGTVTNGTLRSTLPVSAGACHRYYFRFTSASGESFFPTTGSFGIGCAEDWVSTRPAACGGSVDGGTDGPDGGVDSGSDAANDSGSGTCAGDLNADGTVNSIDLSMVLQAWGPSSGSSADLNQNGVVNSVDLSLLLDAWGPCSASPSIVGIATGGYHSCARRSDGSVQCWGRNNGRQVAPILMDTITTPIAVTGVTNASQVSLGYEYSCARSGNVSKCWGADSSGQAGDGSAGFNLTPTQTLFANVTALPTQALGHWHSCALSSGLVSCAGSNTHGQLGNGIVDATPLIHATPSVVSGLTGVVQLSNGYFHNCARFNDGTAKCWGENGAGQTGIGDDLPEYVTSPMTVNLSSIAQIVAGSVHSCAVRNDGSVWCWGGSGSGQLGNGSTFTQYQPVHVIGPTGIVQAAASSGHNCAVGGDGRLWCWGRNLNGQVGNGALVNQLTPVLLSLNNVVEVACGEQHTCARRGDGSVWCWGQNSQGQLGNGTTTSSTTPVQVSF